MINWVLLFGFKLPTGLNNLFFCLADPSGTVHPEITNKNGNPNYKYFYSNAEQGNPPSCLGPVLGKKKKMGGRGWLLWFGIFFFFAFCSRDQHEGGAGPADGRHLQARPHWRRAVGGDAGQAVRATLPTPTPAPPPPPPEPAPPVSAAEPSQPRKRLGAHEPLLSSSTTLLVSPPPLSFVWLYSTFVTLLLIKNPCAHTSCL